MSTPTVYVICDQNCKFEGMTKEQILTAIVQAVNEGTIGDIDTGFITTIKTITGTPLKFFVGEQSEYEALTAEEKENLFAIITNDTIKEGILNAIKELQTNYEELENKLLNGSFVVKSATKLVNGNLVFGRELISSFTSKLNKFTGEAKVLSKSLTDQSYLIVEVEVYTGATYGSQFLGKYRTPPFYASGITYQNVTIPSVFKYMNMAFTVKDNKLNYWLTEGGSSDTDDVYYLKALYKEL